MPYVGQRVKRTEDPRLIKGLAHYVDDIKLPDTLHVAFVRSVYAHARITSIDTSQALQAPGVVAVLPARTLRKLVPCPAASALPDLKVPDYRVLAQGKVFSWAIRSPRWWRPIATRPEMRRPRSGGLRRSTRGHRCRGSCSRWNRHSRELRRQHSLQAHSG